MPRAGSAWLGIADHLYRASISRSAEDIITADAVGGRVLAGSWRVSHGLIAGRESLFAW